MVARLYILGDRARWQELVSHSVNASLFDDLDFLQYHEAGKFDLHHIVFVDEEKIIAVMAASVVLHNDKKYLRAPYGGSAGGPVFAKATRFAQMTSAISTLKEYCVSQGFHGVIVRLHPAVYNENSTDAVSFALYHNGFRITNRWLTMMTPLPSDMNTLIKQIPERKARYFRQAVSSGELNFSEASEDKLEEFYAVLLANRAKFNAKPSHSLRDLHYLIANCRNRIRLFLTSREQKIMAGALIFELTEHVAYAFYLCHLEESEPLRASLFTLMRTQQHYIEKGFRYFDLGPATFDNGDLNEGGIKFKEESGCVGYNRDEWTYELKA